MFSFIWTRSNVYAKRPSLAHSEVVFNTNIIFPIVQAMMFMVKKNGYEPYFVPREEEIVAMTVQLKSMHATVNKRQVYRVDGVVRLGAAEDVEVAILETAGTFKSDDKLKVTFDNSKGMLALLAMLKTIAGMYKYALIDEFKRFKL